MGIKVLAGDWAPGTVCVFEPAFFGKPNRIRMARVFGPEYSDSEVVSIDLLTEQNSTSVFKKAGWGAVGGLALGPLGMFAGLLGGGNRHEKIVAIEFTDGKRALLQVDTKSYAEIMRLAFKPRKEPERQDLDQALPDSFRKDGRFEEKPVREEAPQPKGPDFMNGLSISFGKTTK
ncbi:hypothetical protein ACTOV4_15235 [Brucella sp. C7-11G]